MPKTSAFTFMLGSRGSESFCVTVDSEGVKSWKEKWVLGGQETSSENNGDYVWNTRMNSGFFCQVLKVDDELR